MHATIEERRLLEGIQEHCRFDLIGDDGAALAGLCIDHARLGSQEAPTVIATSTEKGFITVACVPISHEPIDDIRHRHERMTLTLTGLGWRELSKESGEKMADRKLLGHDLWKAARLEAQKLWDDGYFDATFRLRKPRGSMSVCKAGVETIQIEDDGRIFVDVFIPSPCGCCEGDKSSFELP